MKLKVFGFCVIILAEASAYSAYAPMNCSLVAPYTSSPCLNPATLAPTVSTASAIPTTLSSVISSVAGATDAYPLVL